MSKNPDIQVFLVKRGEDGEIIYHCPCDVCGKTERNIVVFRTMERICTGCIHRAMYYIDKAIKETFGKREK
jgi:hypothetical protein